MAAQTTTLTMDTDPLVEGWTAPSGNGGSHSVAGGVLTIDSANPCCYYFVPPAAIWDNVVDNSTTFVFEARMKIITAGTTIFTGAAINANAAGRAWAVYIQDGQVDFGGNTIAMDTTSDFHVYRLEAGLLTADLFIDGIEVLSDVPYGGGGSLTLFGHSTNATTHSEWDYFTITTNDPAAPEPVTWTLSNVVFDDTATASGSFDYDAATNSYDNVNITITGGTGPAWTVDPFTYTSTTAGVPSPSRLNSFVMYQVNNPEYPCDVGSFEDCQRALQMEFASPLTSLGGDINIAITPTSRETLTATGASGSEDHTRNFSGGLVSAPQIIPVNIRVNNDTAIHAHHTGPTPHDVLPVDVFGEAGFDVTDIIDATVMVGPSGALDRDGAKVLGFVDGDGFQDATYDFWMADTGIACSDTEVTLVGDVTGGASIVGTDAVTTDCNAGCH